MSLIASQRKLTPSSGPACRRKLARNRHTAWNATWGRGGRNGGTGVILILHHIGRGMALWPRARAGLVALALLAVAGPVSAQSSWAGPYVGAGLAVDGMRLDLDTLSASAGGRPVDLGPDHLIGAFAYAGYRQDVGALVLGAEAEIQQGHALGPNIGCVLRRVCADAGLIGDYGPLYRLRLVAGYPVAPDTLLIGGAGLGLALVTASHAYAVAATAQGGSGVITTARSPFVVEDMAHGLSLMLGVEHRLTDRAAIRFDVVHDRLRVASSARVFIFTQTTTGSTTSTAQIVERGNFSLITTSARLSFVVRF